MDFVTESGFRLIDTGFRKFWWISWISIFIQTLIWDGAATHVVGQANTVCRYHYYSLTYIRSDYLKPVGAERGGPSEAEVGSDRYDHFGMGWTTSVQSNFGTCRFSLILLWYMRVMISVRTVCGPYRYIMKSDCKKSPGGICVTDSSMFDRDT